MRRILRPVRFGLTIPELIICLVVGVVVLLLLAPNICLTSEMRRAQMTQVLSNMKQLHLATQQMELDGETTGNHGLGWPGDTDGSFRTWATNLVAENYLSTNDLCKLLSAAGRFTPPEQVPLFNTNGVLVYAVSTNLPANSVFLSSANFTNTPAGGLPPLTNAKPFGGNGLVVFHLGGDGAILQAKQAGKTNFIGGYAPLCR